MPDSDDLADEYEDGDIDEDEYEDLAEELAAELAEELAAAEREEEEEEEYERRARRRGGVKSLWGDLTGARIFPGGLADSALPDPAWSVDFGGLADPDAWRA